LAYAFSIDTVLILQKGKQMYCVRLFHVKGLQRVSIRNVHVCSAMRNSKRQTTKKYCPMKGDIPIKIWSVDTNKMLRFPLMLKWNYQDMHKTIKYMVILIQKDQCVWHWAKLSKLYWGYEIRKHHDYEWWWLMQTYYGSIKSENLDKYFEYWMWIIWLHWQIIWLIDRQVYGYLYRDPCSRCQYYLRI
jgi:hypothetical protein